MTTLQATLIETLAARRITAAFIGQTLSGTTHINRGGKKVKQSFVLAFDDAATLEGPRMLSNRGTYGESYARDAFFECLLAVDENDAAKYHSECKAVGIRSGAPQSWIDAQAATA